MAERRPGKARARDHRPAGRWLPAHANPYRSERVTTLRWQGVALEGLWTRFATLGWRSAIVGPHGSGKTTLLEALLADAPHRGLRARMVRLAGAPRHPCARAMASALAADPTIVVGIDGGERLSLAGRTLLAAATRRARGVLVTRHSGGWLPTLVATATSPQLLAALVAELAPEDAGRLASGLPDLWRRHQGNLRACLGELYDHAAGRDSAYFVSGLAADI
jgi:hypothetical protein